MAKIDEMPDYRAKLPSHTHDLSHDFGFTCTTAHLLPVFHDYLNAGETVKLGFNYFLRTQPLQSAAMSKLKTHVEYFFVPMNLLFQPFGSFLYGVKDEYSSFYINDIRDTLPVVNIDDILDSVSISNRSQYQLNGVAVGDSDPLLAFRLADMFGFDATRMLVDQADKPQHVNPNVFPYQYLAYNCIYEYYYRLDNRERFTNKLFNLDEFYNTSAPLGRNDFAQVPYMFGIKYRPLGSDYFTDCKVSPIVDVLNLNNKNNFQLATNWLSRNTLKDSAPLDRPVLKSGDHGIDGTNGINGSPNYVSGSPAGSIQTQFGFTASGYNVSVPNGVDINTANIRALFANEKLWSITGRAKKHYDDQVLAHLGFKVPHDPKHEITCFGHDVGDISIGEVISTSNTYDSSTGDGSPLAEIAGKGYGNLQGKEHTFTAPCHGVIMVIFSVVADRNYIEGFPKYNVMSGRSDLYQPEYDHLGMQPLFSYETNDDVIVNHSNIYGWQYRYEQWKRRYSRLTLAFGERGVNCPPAPFASWFNVSYADKTYSFVNTANFNSYVNFLNLPTDVNSIMLLAYDSIPSFDNTEAKFTVHPYLTDPFIVSSRISCKKISTMSDFSLPRLDA